MNPQRYVSVLLLILLQSTRIFCWTDEDLELFDLVENTDKKFYDVLGVDQKASASDIRKAYRRLSTLYHPDKNKEPNAEETFRKIAAIADILRNEEQRKKYDVILQTGLPDWREPIYYYRRVRNMGLFQLIVFLFCLATFGQYLFAWSAYWEKKYEIEEFFMSKMKKKAKNQRKSKNAKPVEEVDAAAAEISNLPKPRYQDLFPIQLVYLAVYLIKSSPSYLKSAIESCRSLWKGKPEIEEIDEEQEERKIRQRPKKYVKPLYPELNGTKEEANSELCNGKSHEKKKQEFSNGSDKAPTSHVSEADLNEFKKAMKKFPNGTLRRWEKISEYLNCSVSEVIAMAKQMKSQQFVKNVPISAQGVTGFEENLATINLMTNEKTENEAIYDVQEDLNNSLSINGTVSHRVSGTKDCSAKSSEKVWKQEQQQLLEVALQKFPKETPGRWDCVAQFVQSKTKEECIIRYKELAQQIKLKKGKEN